MAVHEPIDTLLTCVRQVMLLAKPRDKQLPDSVMDTTDMDTVPSVLKAPHNDSEQANQVHKAQTACHAMHHNCCAIWLSVIMHWLLTVTPVSWPVRDEKHCKSHLPVWV